jgi:hypothetical protein
MARNKRDHAKVGTVLIGDQERHRHLWEEVSGVFNYLRDAETSLA